MGVVTEGENFGQEMAHYDLMVRTNKAFVAWLVEFLRLPREAWVLDLGAGEGWFADMMTEHVDHVYATDIAPRPRNRQGSRTRWFAADVFQFPALRHGFDLIFVHGLAPFDLASSVTGPAWHHVAETLCGLLRPAGRIYWVVLGNNSGKRDATSRMSNRPVQELVRDFFGRIGTLERVVTMVGTSYLVRHGGQVQIPASSEYVVVVHGSSLHHQLASAIVGAGQLLANLPQAPLRLVGSLRCVALVYFVLRVICHVSQPIVWHGRSVLIRCVADARPDLENAFLITGYTDQALKNFERKYRRIAFGLSGILCVLQRLRASDAIVVWVLRRIRRLRTAWPVIASVLSGIAIFSVASCTHGTHDMPSQDPCEHRDFKAGEGAVILPSKCSVPEVYAKDSGDLIDWLAHWTCPKEAP